MNYKDKSFEIDEIQIKINNRILITYLLIFTPIVTVLFISSKSNLLSAILSIIGVITAFLIFRAFVSMYLKSTIDLSEISYVESRIWDKSIDEDSNFWGTGRYKYHFPTGLNKKTNPKVIFVHRKEKKLAVGFVPENFENAISVLKEKGIKITTETSGMV